MNTLLAVIAIIYCPFSLILGLINPKWAFLNLRKKATRVESSLLSLSLFVSTIIIGAILSPIESTSTNEVNPQVITTTPTSTAEIQLTEKTAKREINSTEYANSLRNRLSTEEGVAFFSGIPNDTILNQKSEVCNLINGRGILTTKAVVKTNLVKLIQEKEVYINDTIAEDITDAIVYTANEYGCK